MYTIEIEHECGCFKKSNFKNNMTFETKEDCIAKARVMECLMNQQFCMKHFFEAVDYGDKIVIHSSLRPEHEDDEDIRALVSRSPVKIHFSEGEDTPNGANCGIASRD